MTSRIDFSGKMSVDVACLSRILGFTEYPIEILCSKGRTPCSIKEEQKSDITNAGLCLTCKESWELSFKDNFMEFTISRPDVKVMITSST